MLKDAMLLAGGLLIMADGARAFLEARRRDAAEGVLSARRRSLLSIIDPISKVTDPPGRSFPPRGIIPSR